MSNKNTSTANVGGKKLIDRFGLIRVLQNSAIMGTFGAGRGPSKICKL